MGRGAPGASPAADPAFRAAGASTFVPAGYGKVAAVDELRDRLGVPGDRIVYVGDGSSDIHVMLHVNRCDGLTIAASEARFIARIAQRTVMSDDALSVLIPVLEDILGYNRNQIRALFEHHGVLIQEWDRIRTDWLTIREGAGEILTPISTPAIAPMPAW